MQHYIYILSNPSMPGLIKVGKTTTHPDQRMSELHSTGVPTPFVLEFSIEVNDCSVSERNAHNALENHRVAKNREFFKISVAKALKIILPVVGGYKIHSFRDAYGVESIEREIARKKEEELAAERARAEKEKLQQAERQRTFEQQQLIKEQRNIAINTAISTEERKLQQLGQRPVREALPTLFEIIMYAYLPIPFGWISYIAALRIFDKKGTEIGFIAIALIIVGFISHKIDSGYQEKYDKKNNPFLEIDKKIKELRDGLSKA